MARLGIMNNKGGVGKTLVTLGVAEAAARMGARVLVVDMDPQGNATRRAGVVPGPGDTLTDCLRVGVKPGAASGYLHHCQWTLPAAELIDVLPADLDLEDRALEAGQAGADKRLRKALYGVDDAYELTLFDCQPSIKGHLVTMAFGALNGEGDGVVVPTEPERDAIAGAQRIGDYLRLWREDLGVPHADVLGLVLNRVRGGTNLHAGHIRQLPQSFPGVPVLGAIPLKTRTAELQDEGTPLMDDRDLGGGTDPLTGVAASLHALADRLLNPVPAAVVLA